MRCPDPLHTVGLLYIIQTTRHRGQTERSAPGAGNAAGERAAMPSSGAGGREGICHAGGRAGTCHGQGCSERQRGANWEWSDTEGLAKKTQARCRRFEPPVRSMLSIACALCAGLLGLGSAPVSGRAPFLVAGANGMPGLRFSCSSRSVHPHEHRHGQTDSLSLLSARCWKHQVAREGASAASTHPSTTLSC